MKYIFLYLSMWFALAATTLSEKTMLTGIAKDANSGEALIGAAVKVTLRGTLVIGGITDVDGRFCLQVAPGTYDVECAYVGYESMRIKDVKVLESQLNTLDFALSSGALLEEVVVVQYKQPLIKKDETSSGTVVTSEGIRPMSRASKKEVLSKSKGTAKASEPTKSVPMPMAAPAPATAGEMPTGKPTPVMAPMPAEMPAVDGGAVTVKGARAKTDAYHVDGVRVEFEKRKTEAPKHWESMKMTTMPVIDDKLEADKTLRDEDGPDVPTEGGAVSPRAGLLTGGEWNDLHHWEKHWSDLLTDGEIDQYQNMYKFYPKHRYSVLLHNENGFPITDATVVLADATGATIWQARTDNSGKAELWAGLFDKTDPKNLRLSAIIKGQKSDLGEAKPLETGVNQHTLPFECGASQNVDIMWAVDATGSMGDEIEYLKTELLDVIGRVKNNNPSLNVRMGTVFYRDKGDEYLTKNSGLSTDIAKTVDFIRKQFAGGGGDYPEAVHSALEEAVFQQTWSQDAVARICFLVLDASPHQNPEVIASLQQSIKEAAARGIRIVPLSASGIKKDTEFLMKFFGLATNGTYTFLTDHSGIGGKHLEPTTDEYKVEALNDLLVRIITEYTTTETCEGKSSIRFEPGAAQPNAQPQDNWEAQYFPNPASTQFTLDLPIAVETVTIYNAEGQAVRKLNSVQAGQTTIEVGDLPQGFYTIRILKDNQWQSGKLMVVRA